MEQFNLEEYKKNPNRRVITRDGKSVRIVCTDMMGTSYPVLAICRVDPTHDCDYSYTPNGKHNLGVDSRLDLFFAPEKKKGWANLYDLPEGPYLGRVYSSKEVAESMIKNCGLHPYIATVEIEWEE